MKFCFIKIPFSMNFSILLILFFVHFTMSCWFFSRMWLIVGEDGLIYQGVGSVGSTWAEMWRSRVFTSIYKYFSFKTTTDTHIFKYFYCILLSFLICSSFFPIIVKSCFLVSTSKFREMSPFSIPQKLTAFR